MKFLRIFLNFWPSSETVEYLEELKKQLADWLSLSTNITGDCVIIQKLVGLYLLI